MQYRSKPHRLPDGHYEGQVTVSITARLRAGLVGLSDPQVVPAMVETLRQSADAYGTVIPIYCFMPDHVHFMVLGTHPSSLPLQTAKTFKQRSGFWFSRNRPQLRWQQSFYDDILRPRDGFAVQARYIALNPVRAGLAESIADWPHTGAIGCEFNEVLVDSFWH